MSEDKIDLKELLKTCNYAELTAALCPEMTMTVNCDAKNFFSLSDFTELQGNLKALSDKNMFRLAYSILKHGFIAPVFAWRDKKSGNLYILDAHQRHKVLTKLQEIGVTIPPLPTTLIDCKNKRDAKEKLLAISSRYGNITKEGFEEYINEIDFELSLPDISDYIDFPEIDLEEMMNANLVAHEDDYEAPPVNEIKTDIVRGDIITFSKNGKTLHRLMCGDSTNSDDVSKLMNGEKAELLLTDPPYGIKADKGFEGFEGFGGFGKPIKRRNYEDDWDSERPSLMTFNLALPTSKNAIIFGGNFFADLLPTSKHWLVWDKLNTMPTFGDCELAWTNIERNSVKKYTIQYNGLLGKETERFHPTQKPVKLFVEILIDYTIEGSLINDLFLGSGSTMVAAHQLNRKCYGMEIDEKYCQVIVDRMKKLDSELVVEINHNKKD